MQAVVTYKSEPTEKGDFEVYFNIVDEKGNVLYKDIKIYLNASDYVAKIESRSADILSYKEEQKTLPDVIELDLEAQNGIVG